MMKNAIKYFTVLVFIFLVAVSNISAQVIKVAILDFENSSGIAKYDGLGKAMSSMLISDIETNVSPRRLQLVERSQIQNILKEQNFQASSAVDKTSSVKAGKILGVKYLLLGDIYVLNDALVINARFVDAETGDIKFSKKQEGKLSTWLSLKTNIAKELATSISMPFTEPATKDIETPIATITTFGNAIRAKDTGNIQMAEKLAETVQEFSPNFKYIDDLKEQIDILKKQINQNIKDIEVLKKSGGRVIDAVTPKELVVNYANPLSTVNEKKQIIIELLKFDLDKVTEGYFNEFYHMDIPYIRNFGWGNLENWSLALNFLDSILTDKRRITESGEEKVLNPNTVAYYVFLQLLSYTSYISDCDHGEIKYIFDISKLESEAAVNNCTDEAIIVLKHLDWYMLNNEIEPVFDNNRFEGINNNFYIFYYQCRNNGDVINNYCKYTCSNLKLTLSSLGNFLNTKFNYR